MTNMIVPELGHKAKISAIQANACSAGPGLRSEVFFFGCSRGCPGCINDWVQEEGHYNELSVADILVELERFHNPRISISGGEPFEQIEALAYFCKWARTWLNTNPVHTEHGSIWLYTGWDWSRVKLYSDWILKYVDWICVGPYIEELRYQKVKTSVVGSSNQRIITLKNGQWAGEVPVDKYGRIAPSW